MTPSAYPTPDAFTSPIDPQKSHRQLYRFSLLALSAPELAREAHIWECQRLRQETAPPSDLRDAGIAWATHHRDLALAELRRTDRASLPDAPWGDDRDADFDRARYVDLVGLVQTLTAQPGRKEGRLWRFRCPFHQEDSASLAVYEPGLGWHCFGCGRGGGDAVSFVAEHFHINQFESLRLIEQMCDL